MTAADPTALLDTLTRELLLAGWSHHAAPDDERPGRRTDQRSFTDPTRTVQVHACAYLEAGDLETRLWGVDPHRPTALEPRWWAGTGALAPAVILAAAHAATAPDPTPPRSVQARLRAAGWHLAEQLHEGARLSRSATAARTAPAAPAGSRPTRPGTAAAG